jgi:hypothetical protein
MSTGETVPSRAARRATLRTSLLNWLSDNPVDPTTLKRDSGLNPRDALIALGFTDRENFDEAYFLNDKELIRFETRRPGPGEDERHMVFSDAHLLDNGVDCVERFGGDVNAWLGRNERGASTHIQTTISNSPGAQSMNSSPGAQQTATVTISQDSRTQLLQIADQIADQIAGLPTEIAPAATAGVEELRQAANDNSADPGRVKAVLGKIAVGVAVAVGTDAGQAILGLVGQAAKSLGG